MSIPGIFSIRANLASPKTLVWSNVSFLDQGTRVTIYLTVPKASIGRHGHAIFLNCNPVACFCPVTFLPKVKKSYPDQGPVFRLKLGKFLTPSLVYKILSEVGTLANLTPGTPYSCHSLCAGAPTAMALHANHFPQAEMLAMGKWQSSTTDCYIHCQQQAAESISNKVYSLI